MIPSCPECGTPLIDDRNCPDCPTSFDATYNNPYDDDDEVDYNR